MLVLSSIDRRISLKPWFCPFERYTRTIRHRFRRDNSSLGDAVSRLMSIDCTEAIDLQYEPLIRAYSVMSGMSWKRLRCLVARRYNQRQDCKAYRLHSIAEIAAAIVTLFSGQELHIFSIAIQCLKVLSDRLTEFISRLGGCSEALLACGEATADRKRALIIRSSEKQCCISECEAQHCGFKMRSCQILTRHKYKTASRRRV